jgi:hypothetical protein
MSSTQYHKENPFAINYGTIADNSVITWDASTKKWGAEAIPAQATPNLSTVLTAGNSAAAKITNLTTATVSTDAANLGNVTTAVAAQTLDNHVDVTITAPTNGQILTYNTGIWENTTPAFQATGEYFSNGGNTFSTPYLGTVLNPDALQISASNGFNATQPNMTIATYTGSTQGGAINILSGGNNGGLADNTGASATLGGGNATSGGSLTLTSGDCQEGFVSAGCQITLQAGNTSKGGDLTLQAGDGSTGGLTGGRVIIRPAAGTPNGDVTIGTVSTAVTVGYNGLITAGATGYESLVSAGTNNAIPNRKYIHDRFETQEISVAANDWNANTFYSYNSPAASSAPENSPVTINPNAAMETFMTSFAGVVPEFHARVLSNGVIKLMVLGRGFVSASNKTGCGFFCTVIKTTP